MLPKEKTGCGWGWSRRMPQTGLYFIRISTEGGPGSFLIMYLLKAEPQNLLTVWVWDVEEKSRWTPGILA